MAKASFEDEPSFEGGIDTERIVIDPDYRRAVLALLRRGPRSGEAAPSAAEMPALSEE
jgi:hypothetical protein